jgi:hypothetical protein
METMKTAKGSAGRIAALRQGAANAIKFQKKMPHYSHMGSTP